jgi:pimeloyl-ACP methyl ester carboxylesterase
VAEVATRLDGLAFDNLAWGGRWDVDPRDVRTPTALWYGDVDVLVPAAHGRWYAERIPGAHLTVHPGEGHAEVCSSHWGEQLEELLALWD